MDAPRRWFLSGAAIVVVLAACGSSDDDGPFATSPARVIVDDLGGREGAVVTVEGSLVAQPGMAPRLCAALAESYPPQCAGESVGVPGLDVTRISATSTNDDAPADLRVVWSDLPIGVTGRVESGDLALAGDPVNGDEPAVLVRAEAGPTCAVETDPPDPACASRPVADATIELRTLAGDVASTVTDALGVAVFTVDAGDYDVAAIAVTGLPGTPEVQRIAVGAGTTTVLLSYDTGIR